MNTNSKCKFVYTTSNNEGLLRCKMVQPFTLRPFSIIFVATPLLVGDKYNKTITTKWKYIVDQCYHSTTTTILARAKHCSKFFSAPLSLQEFEVKSPNYTHIAHTHAMQHCRPQRAEMCNYTKTTNRERTLMCDAMMWIIIVSVWRIYAIRIHETTSSWSFQCCWAHIRITCYIWARRKSNEQNVEYYFIFTSNDVTNAHATRFSYFVQIRGNSGQWQWSRLIMIVKSILQKTYC